MLRIIIIIFGIISTISVYAQNEVIGGCVKKDGIASGINATKRFPMYSVMKFPQALIFLDNGKPFPIAVFINNPSPQSQIPDVAKLLLEE